MCAATKGDHRMPVGDGQVQRGMALLKRQATLFLQPSNRGHRLLQSMDNVLGRGSALSVEIDKPVERTMNTLVWKHIDKYGKDMLGVGGAFNAAQDVWP